MNVLLSYKPPSSWRILFWSGGCPSNFIHLKKFRSLVVPNGGCREGIIIQGRHLPSYLPVIGYSCLRIKRYADGVSVHAPIQRNISYTQVFRRSIYKTRRPKNPHLPIGRYERRPQRPIFSTPLQKPLSPQICTRLGY